MTRVVIDGFPAYSVDECGNVYSHARCTFPKGGRGGNVPETKILKPVKVKGYPKVSLYSSPGKPVNHEIHRLVAENLIPKPEGALDVVNHIDQNKENYHASNLEWLTHRENMNHWRLRKDERQAAFAEGYAEGLQACRQHVHLGHRDERLESSAQSLHGTSLHRSDERHRAALFHPVLRAVHRV